MAQQRDPASADFTNLMPCDVINEVMETGAGLDGAVSSV
jgi:hypothetical protein